MNGPEWHCNCPVVILSNNDTLLLYPSAGLTSFETGFHMALAFKLSKENFEALDESVKGLYVVEGEGYTLGVDGLPEVEDVTGLKSTIAKLKDEKTAGQRRAQEAADEAARIAREKATKANDFEALYKSSEAEREKTANAMKELQGSITSEKLNTAALKLAGTVADKSNAKLLSTFIKPRLSIIDGETKVLDAAGQPTVSTQEDLMKEFAASGDYDSLLRGNQSGGGGAAQGSGGGAAGKTITRTEFNAMPDAKRAAHFKEGGKITDE